MARQITGQLLRKLYHQEPFQPFFLVAENGRKIQVKRRDRLVIAPSGRFILVVNPDGSILQVNLNRMVDFQLLPRRAAYGSRGEARRRKAG